MFQTNRVLKIVVMAGSCVLLVFGVTVVRIFSNGVNTGWHSSMPKDQPHVVDEGRRTPPPSTPVSKVTQENFLRVQVGMTKADVQLILGDIAENTDWNVDGIQPKQYVLIFKGNNHVARITVSRQGIVTNKGWED